MKTLAKFSNVLMSLLLVAIIISCEQKDDTPTPVACFEMSSDEVATGELVTFSDCSTDAEIYSWDFGDGSTSQAISPSHTYSNAGQYAVKLKVFNKDKFHEETKAITVLANLGACFVMSSTKVEIGEQVTFTNCSADADRYSWDFGDGSTSQEKSPSHTYSDAGQYSVKLRAYKNDNYKEETKVITVVDIGTGGNLSACFTYNPGTVMVNQTVEFTNCSDGEDSYSWDFGDGTTSTLEDPIHTFNEVGDYTVMLTVSDGDETDMVKKIIQVQDEGISTTSVTFFLQMYVPYAWGDFDPETDKVEIVGSFNDWGSTPFVMYRMNDSSTIYGIEISNLEINSEIQFRFKIETIEGTFEETDDSGLAITRDHAVSSEPDMNILSYFYEDEDMLWVDGYSYDGVPIRTIIPYYYDDFSEPELSYYFQGTGEDYAAEISNGVYTIENYNTEFANAFTAGYLGPDETTNFEIEYAMVCTTSEVNSGSGVIWGVDADNWEYFAFYMAPDGQYKVGENGSDWTDWLDWQAGGNVAEEFNKVTIRYLNGKFYIFVNEDFVCEATTSTFYGLGVGAIVARSNNVNFDFINVSTINLDFVENGKAKPVIHPDIVTIKEAKKSIAKQNAFNVE